MKITYHYWFKAYLTIGNITSGRFMKMKITYHYWFKAYLTIGNITSGRASPPLILFESGVECDACRQRPEYTYSAQEHTRAHTYFDKK